MTPRHRPLHAAVLLCSLVACRANPAPLSAADIDAIERGSQQFVAHMLAGNADSVSHLYAEDAVLMPANMAEVRGRAAIRTFFAGFPPVAEARLANDTIVGFGDLAYVRGRYFSRLKAAGAPADSGKFIEIRRRGPDGRWQFVAEIFNSSVPLPAPASP